MSLSNLNQTTCTNLEQLVAMLLYYISDAVRWAYLQYQGGIRQDELDDLSQQIVLTLIENNCRRLRSFNYQSSFKTWLQAIVNNFVHNHFHRRKKTESLNEVDCESLIFAPPQDQEIDAAEKKKLLLRALGMLSEEERLLYQLWFVSELDAHEIAAVFRTDVRTIYKRKQTLVLNLTRLVRNFQNH